MDRRGFLIGGLAVLAGGNASAQRTYRIAVLVQGTARSYAGRFDALRAALSRYGYVEGRNVAFESRFARGRFDQLPALAEDLVRLKVAAIVTSGRVATHAAMKATSTIPIVTATGDDPVEQRAVAHRLGRRAYLIE